MSADGNSYPYSTVRRAAGLVFLSGEVGFDDDGNIPEGIVAQTELVLRRIERTLQKVGLALANVVSATVYLSNEDDFAAFNDEYRRLFGAPYPVRTTVCARLLDPVLVEISIVASDDQ